MFIEQNISLVSSKSSFQNHSHVLFFVFLYCIVFWVASAEQCSLNIALHEADRTKNEEKQGKIMEARMRQIKLKLVDNQSIKNGGSCRVRTSDQRFMRR